MFLNSFKLNCKIINKYKINYYYIIIIIHLILYFFCLYNNYKIYFLWLDFKENYFGNIKHLFTLFYYDQYNFLQSSSKKTQLLIDLWVGNFLSAHKWILYTIFNQFSYFTTSHTSFKKETTNQSAQDGWSFGGREKIIKTLHNNTKIECSDVKHLKLKQNIVYKILTENIFSKKAEEEKKSSQKKTNAGKIWTERGKSSRTPWKRQHANESDTARYSDGHIHSTFSCTVTVTATTTSISTTSRWKREHWLCSWMDVPLSYTISFSPVLCQSDKEISLRTAAHQKRKWVLCSHPPFYLSPRRHCQKEKFFFGVAQEKRPTLKSSLNLGKFGSSTKSEIHLEPSLPHFMVVEILWGTYTHTHTHASTCACFVDCC